MEQNRAEEHVDRKDIDKHRNDVFRLLLSLAPSESISLPPAIRRDLRQFIDRFPSEATVWAGIRASLESTKLRLPDPGEVVRRFQAFHGLE